MVEGFFPYDEKGSPLTYELLSECESVCRYLEDHAERLLKGRKEVRRPIGFVWAYTGVERCLYLEVCC